jgi:PKD repeat protein
VGSAGVQQGIYDIRLDPDFVNNHFYYIFYTAGTPNRDRLSRFTANAALTGTVAGSELVLYEDPQNASAEHHGGAINFGNDGKIYFTTGEHFNAGDAQSLSSPRGKIHRINRDGTIPADNPFYDGAGSNWDSIWARGLRNPFRAYYDAPSGRLLVGDVGGNDYAVAKEEVNLGIAGANYGWPNSEGPCLAPCTSPLYSYPHNGRDASITGGFVYHGTQFPSAYQGSYFFADYTQNWIRRLTFGTNGTVNGVFNFEPADGSVDGPYGDIVYLTEGPEGALYYVDLGYSDIGGTFGISKIRRIRYIQANQAPVAVASATPTKGPGPLTVNFSSNGSLDPEGQPLSYFWTFGDNATSTGVNPAHTYTQNGQYTVRLSVSDGVNTTLAAPLLISVGNPPTVTILSPPNGLFFRAGNVISFSGDGTDVEDGVLPASAFTWNIDFLHEGHVHPGLPGTGTKSGTFTIPTTGHDYSGNTRYRITLTVTDSDGLQSSQAVLVYPDKVNLPFDTVPTGLALHLDGIARTAPFVHDTLIGFKHTIEAQDQIQATTTYTFASWSDGGAYQHAIVVPTTAQPYTATYIATPILLPQGLVGAWNFSEGVGTSANDSSGNGNTATLINGTAWAAGQYDNGLSFNGVNNYLSVLNSLSLDISGNALTLSMWINPQPLSEGDFVVLGKFWTTTMTSPYYQYGLELSGGREPFLYIGTNIGFLIARMGSDLSLGQWSHLAVVFNGSQVQFYVNGLLVSTQPLAATIQARGRPLHIGADIRPLQFYKGLLDEVQIYNRALTSSEVLTDMTTALPTRFE